MGPVFCVHEFEADGMNIRNVLDDLENPVQVTGDWFVDALLVRWVPDEEREDIVEHLRMVRSRVGPDSPPPLLLGAALIWAEAAYHLRERARAEKPLQSIIETLLSVDPFKPTEAAFEVLFNGLLDLFTPYQVSWYPAEQIWRVR
ncbi:MAG: hypothetical protein ABSD38_21465 [Syntrophorhabdales bacterium]